MTTESPGPPPGPGLDLLEHGAHQQTSDRRPFARLSARDQATILREHAALGRAYGDGDLAHDVRLACHGLDRNDNDFVIGLVGRELHPLSHLVQAMRKTAQTSEYIQSLGPFFVGHAIWRGGLARPS